MRLLLAAMLVLFAAQLKSATIRIAEWGDIHTYHIASGYASNHNAAVEWCTNNGVNIVRWLGDCYDQGTNYLGSAGSLQLDQWTVTDLTNAAQLMIDAGIMVFPTDGNHDADDSTSTNSSGGEYAGAWPLDSGLEWTNVFPLSFYSSQAGYVTGYNSGDVQQVAMAYTNDGVKLLLVNLDSSVSGGTNGAADVLPQTQWVTNLGGLYPDHNVLCHWHFGVGTRSVPGADHWPRLTKHDISGGPVQYFYHGVADWPWELGLKSMDNLLEVSSGHTRALPSGHVGVRADDGHSVDVRCFNMQQADSFNGHDPNGSLVAVTDIDTKKRWVSRYIVNIHDNTTIAVGDTNLSVSTLYLSQPGHTFVTQWDFPLITPSPRGKLKLK